MWAGQSRWGGSGNKWDKDSEPMGEINVTPLVDVMLVLLIIFMVAAPLLTQGVNVDLPDAKAPAMQQNIEPLVITIKKNGSIYMQKHQVSLKQLAPRIQAMRQNKPNLPVFIRGDAKTPYQSIAQVMSSLEQAGIKKVGLVTEPVR
ncbi:MAG: protein TolR [Mariprofundaceae bacterium]